MRFFLLALLLLPAAARAADDKDRAKLIAYMLKTPTENVDPALIPPFMAIDHQEVPKKQRTKVRAKQLEFEMLVKVAKGKKKGPFRYPETCSPKTYGPEGAQTMEMIHGNEEVTEEEVEYIKLKTSCTEHQLMCEFTLNIVVVPRENEATLRRYYLMVSDPLMALVGEKRAGGAAAGNTYFQELKPSCQQSYK